RPGSCGSLPAPQPPGPGRLPGSPPGRGGWHRGMPHAPGPRPPPIAPRFLPGGPPAVLASGEPDPYAWMRDRDLPATRDYLAAERAYYDQQLDTGLRDELSAELTARVVPAEASVRWRRDGRTYVTV